MQITGVVDAKPPFGALADDLVAKGLMVKARNGAGLDETLSWASGLCSATPFRVSKKVTCKVKQGRSVVLSATFTPTRVPDVFQAQIKASKRTFVPPLATNALTVILTAGTIDRRADAPSCSVSGRKQQNLTCQ